MTGPSLASIRFQISELVQGLGPAEAARAAQASADDRIREAPARDGWACRLGCAACCHLLVHVMPSEAERLVHHVRETFSSESATALVERARRTADEVADLSAGAYRRARVRCAFLDQDDGCSVYEARPLKCRVHASRSAEACADLEGPVPLDGWLVKVGAAIHAGMGDGPTVELHRAVASAWPG